MLKKARAEAKAEAQSKDAAGTDTQAKALADGVLESSRQIWLAGLGAFARAKGEGMKVFETLVQQGQALESRTKRAAADTATAAQDKAKEMQAKAGGTWDKLEQVFEDRVARALSRLGVYTQADVEGLAQRVDALSEAVNELIRTTGARTAVRAPAGRKRGGKRAGSSAARKNASAAGASKAGEATAESGTAGAKRSPRKSVGKNTGTTAKSAKAR